MKVVIIGAGNLATHLSFALKAAGHQIVQIFSRSQNSASELAGKLNVPFIIDATSINQQADIYFYAVSDDALPSLLSLDIAPDAIHVHTAGSVSMDLFINKKKHFGVFYPLQTFSKNKPVDFKKIPVFIEGSDKLVEDMLELLSGQMAEKSYKADSAQRLKLHVAAVFASNFVNHLYNISSDLVQTAGFSFEVLKPLIVETADKINYLSPSDAQTGPAKRNDIGVINNHLDQLVESSDLRSLYQALTKMIFDKQVHQS
ncbi:hypothetical protein SDC9_143912 [bioreactor metagenome]|uniref:DUF2520 domain-containing protein n=1 Tax=bioreactor metagenome TaxID=1076179 RepID=A0A645E4U1_9ZZZZ|nr:Rossmann-like and DUF2520 domain-containing protein [Paludibacter sp.]